MKVILLIMALMTPAWGEGMPSLLVFGDSLSAGYGLPAGEGWVDLLAKRLAKKYRVVNLSISGETAYDGAERIEAALVKVRPRIVVLELGANDGLRGSEIAAIEKSLGKIVLSCQREKARVLLVGMRLPPNYGARYVENFAAIYPELAKKYRIPLVPFMMEGFAQDLSLFQPDGMHPNERAQPRVLDNIWKVLSPML